MTHGRNESNNVIQSYGRISVGPESVLFCRKKIYLSCQYPDRKKIKYRIWIHTH
jgi:hypothetical protein